MNFSRLQIRRAMLWVAVLLCAMAPALGMAQGVLILHATSNAIPIAGGKVYVDAQIKAGKYPVSSVTVGVYLNGSLIHGANMIRTPSGVYVGTVTVDINTSNSVNGEEIDVVAHDTGGNSDKVIVGTQGFSNVLPLIAKVTYLPDPIPVAGGAVAVTAVVTDVLPIVGVTLHVKWPGGTEVRSVGMKVGADGKTYKGSVDVDLNPDHSRNGQTVNITAVDAATNTDTNLVATQSYAKVPPSISNVVYKPDPLPAAGGLIPITAKIKSFDVPLSVVEVIVNAPGGSFLRSSIMTKQSDGITYKGAATLDENTSNSKPGETIVIEAVDAAGNLQQVELKQPFSAEKPTISNVAYSPKPIPVAGATISVSAKATDKELPLATVQLKVLTPQGLVVRTQGMTVGSDGLTYSGAIQVDLNANNSSVGESLVIDAKDVAGNDKSEVVQIQLNSSAQPVVSNVVLSPKSPPVGGGAISAIALVTDVALPLVSVQLQVLDPHGVLVRYTGMKVAADGITYAGTTSVDKHSDSSVKGESVWIVAIDAANNVKKVPVATQQ